MPGAAASASRPTIDPVAPEPLVPLEVVDRRVVIGTAGQQRGGPVRRADRGDLVGRERGCGHRTVSWPIDQPSGTVLRRVEERDRGGRRRPDAAVRRDDLERVAGDRPARSAPTRSRCSSRAAATRSGRSRSRPACRPTARRTCGTARTGARRRRPRCRPACAIDAARSRMLLERGLADVVGVLGSTSRSRPMTGTGVVDGHVRAVVEDAGLDPACLARRDRADVVRLAGLHDPIPQVAATRRVAQVDLVADLAGPARPADDDRDAVDLGRQRPVVLDVEDLVRRTASAARPSTSGPGPGPGRPRARGP